MRRTLMIISLLTSLFASQSAWAIRCPRTYDGTVAYFEGIKERTGRMAEEMAAEGFAGNVLTSYLEIAESQGSDVLLYLNRDNTSAALDRFELFVRQWGVIYSKRANNSFEQEIRSAYRSLTAFAQCFRNMMRD